MTVQITLLSGLISLFLGTFFGAVLCRRLRIKGFSNFVEHITFILRAIPFYVQLVIAYFVIPDIFQFNMEAYAASIFSLGLCSSGYVAQVIRSSLNTIQDEQWDTAYSLGYSTKTTLRYIIAPQVIYNALPPLSNELEALLKSTAILSSIGVLELTRIGMNIVSRELEPLTIYGTLALFYVALSYILRILSKYVEKRFSHV